MESGKMVLINLFDQWRCRYKKRLVDTVGERETVGQIEIIAWKYLY